MSLLVTTLTGSNVHLKKSVIMNLGRRKKDVSPNQSSNREGTVICFILVIEFTILILYHLYICTPSLNLL